MMGLLIGWVYGHLFEWFMHKHILHSNLGKKKGSVFSFHFLLHHNGARKNNFIDTSYLGLPTMADSAGKEIFWLAILMILHIPFIWISATFYLALFLSMVEYYYKHRKAHTNPEWAKKNLPWHYDHHMSKNQESNFGVRSDWVDVFFGTREYLTIK